MVWREGGAVGSIYKRVYRDSEKAAHGGYWGSQERFYIVESSEVGVNRLLHLQ